MAHYDLHVHAENAAETLEFAKKLGLSGLALVTHWKGEKELESFAKEAKKLKGIDVAVGVEIKAKSPAELRKLAKRLRRRVEIILVAGGESAINRAAVETPEVDILAHPERGRDDSGLDHVMAALARKNSVSVEFNFGELLRSYKKGRTEILSHLMKNAKLARKYKAPFTITSGALSAWGLRSASELNAFGKILGFTEPQIRKALSENLLAENRKRLSGKWIMPGVEIE